VPRFLKGGRKIRPQRDCFFKAGAGVIVALEVEHANARFEHASAVEGSRAFKDPPRILEPLAFKDGNAQQMHYLEVVGLIPKHTPAKRLNVLMPALPIGGENSQQRLRLFPEFLLLLPARVLTVLCKAFSPGESPARIYHRSFRPAAIASSLNCWDKFACGVRARAAVHRPAIPRSPLVQRD
jgi:hypothetical protein